MKDEVFQAYLSRIHQRVEWLVTTCLTSMTLPTAREAARNHLNETIKDILVEVYELAYITAEKKTNSMSLQRYSVNKFKLEEKLRNEIRKEVIDEVFKKYKLSDTKFKDKLKKKEEEENEDKVEEDLE
jgi:hypothetical protein